MLRYVLNRAIDAVLTVALVLTLVFFAMRVLPGDPAVAALGDQASSEQLAAFRTAMGLDAPLPMQYVHFLLDMLRFDFGRSFRTGQPIVGLLLAVLPYTIQLTFAALLVGAIIGILAGIVSATRRGRLPDYLSRALSLLGFCIPEFYLGALLLIVFALRLDLFPIMGGGSTLIEKLHALVLPAVTLGLVMAAFTARLTRSSLLEVLKHDYVRTARADVRALFRSPAHPYTEGLLRAVPRLHATTRRLRQIPGTVPSPTALPAGCRFHPRCSEARPLCTRHAPPELEITATQSAACWKHTGFVGPE
jgi:oligopeptide/dipeptide ABC transporter ATP-binding protein